MILEADGGSADGRRKRKADGEGTDGAPDEVWGKGRTSTDTALVDACYAAERLDTGTRTEAGFRCVRELP